MNTLQATAAAVVVFVAPCLAAAQPEKDKASRLFGPDKVWVAHLQIPAAEWEAMVPTRSFFGVQGKKPKDNAEPRPAVPLRGGFGFDFPYVKGDFEFDGRKYADVGVRFKGNSSFAMSAQSIKKPFKIDINRFVKNQDLHGLKMVNLANNLGEPSQIREALAYTTFRAIGLPAPRTAFVELYLTVPGKHDREFAGLYTLIEQVDKTFLKRHFSNGSGLLVKPEGIQNLPYLGTDWQPYSEFYRPKDDPDEKARQRLIEFTRLVNFAEPEEFDRSIDKYLDVDRALRYLAACSYMVNIDSFVGIGHNYYLYLNPDNNRFTFIPWDLNSSFGMFPLLGGAEAQAQWSIKKSPILAIIGLSSACCRSRRTPPPSGST